VTSPSSPSFGTLEDIPCHDTARLGTLESAVAYVMNQMLEPGVSDSRALGILMAAYEGLG